MGSNLGHGGFIAPTKDDITSCWASTRTLENLGLQEHAEALSRVLQAYERVARLVPYEEKS